jgi:hypothetical protein
LPNADKNKTEISDLDMLKSLKCKPLQSSQASEAVNNTEGNLNDEISDSSVRPRKHSAISKLFHYHSSPKPHSDHAFHDITIQKIFVPHRVGMCDEITVELIPPTTSCTPFSNTKVSFPENILDIEPFPSHNSPRSSPKDAILPKKEKWKKSRAFLMDKPKHVNPHELTLHERYGKIEEVLGTGTSAVVRLVIYFDHRRTSRIKTNGLLSRSLRKKG